VKDAFGVSRETISKIIVKEGGGYVVRSEDGSKRLSKPASKAAAVKRLRQIEYFKHRDG
jgi:hypothetical protein